MSQTYHHMTSLAFIEPAAAKLGTEVVLKAGEQPALILGSYGKGKVALLTLCPTGLGTDGETPWWDWNGWGPLVRNLFTWLDGPPSNSEGQ